MKRIFSFSKKFRFLICSILLAPAVVACAPTESAECSRLIFQPHGSSSFNNAAPACPGTRVYSYDPKLFEYQATWVDSFSKSASDSKEDKKI